MNIGGITAGLQGISAGEGIIEKRRQIQRQEAMEDVSTGNNNKLMELRLQQLEMQIDNQKKTVMRDTGRNALKSFATSGNLYGMNQIATDPELRKTFGNYTNYSMQDGVLMGTKVLEDGSTKVVPIPKEQLTQWIVGSGVQQDLESEQLAKQAAEAKAKKAEAELRAKELENKQQNLETSSAETWLQANPDKTYQDYLQVGKTQTEGRRDTLKQLEVAAQKAQDPNLSEKDHKIAVDNYQRLLGGQGQIRENKDVKDIVSAQELGSILLEGKEKIDYKDRYSKEAEFINTKAYETQKPAVKDFNAKYDTYKVASDLGDQLNEAISAGTYESGPIVSALHTIAKYTPKQIREYINKPEDFSTMLKIDTQTSNYLADVLKQVSGTAVSDTEFMRRLKDTIGSTNYNTKTRQLVFESSLEFNKNKLIQEAKSLVKHGMTGDTYDKLRTLQYGEPPKIEIAQPNTQAETKEYQGHIYQKIGNEWRLIK